MPEHATVTRPRARTAPVGPRRVSGPSRRPLPAVPALPQRGRTGPFERLSRIPDHRVVDRLLRGRACILVIGIMLGGIVAMQVSLLRLNAGISRAVQTKDTLELKNSALQAAIAAGTSGERIREAAIAHRMVDPEAGDTRYLRARPATDPRHAVRRMEPPSEQARQVMANNGLEPNPLAPAAVGGAVPVTTTAVGTTTPSTVAQTAAVPTPVPTPIPTATPVVPPVNIDPGTGAATVG
jgi:hypothetical protein